MSKPAETKQFRQIAKATSIFGGVQVFNIVIAVIRGKALALLLGTAGMGLNGLFMSTLTLVKNMTNLGLSQSAVRDIATASGSGDEEEVLKTVATFRRWIWLTAALGATVSIVFAYYFSVWTFGDGSKTVAFMLLSVTFIFGALTAGTYTVLQGLRKLKSLASANVLGGIAGLFTALPLFYFYREDGIVPAIIASSVMVFLVSLYFRKKLNVPSVKLSIKETMGRGSAMVKLGVSLSVSMLLTSAIAYIVNIYITRTGSLSDLGLFRAGETITTSYVGMIFTAIGIDYFPRLAKSMAASEKGWHTVVQQQAELIMLFIGPVLVLLLATAPIVIKILLSSEFLAITSYLNWAVMGLFLKGIVVTLGFVVLAKGDNRLFLITEFVGKGILLIANIVCYHIWGLEGLGIALFFSFVLNGIMMVFVIGYKYEFYFSKDFAVMTVVLSILLVGAWACSKFLGYPYAYWCNALLFVLTSAFALYELDKRLDIRAIWGSLMQRFKG